MLKRSVYCLALGALVIFLMLFSVFSTVNTENFYSAQYRANNTEKATGMSIDDLMKSTTALLDYMKGTRDDLDVPVTKFGRRRQTFNEREISHMVDVRALYQNTRKVMYFALALSAVLMAALFASDRKRAFFTGLRKAVKPVCIGFLLFGAALGAMFAIDFEKFWTGIHHILFRNNLWLLDPATSTMINMFPEKFFLSMCTRMLITFAVSFAVLIRAVMIASGLGGRKENAGR